MPSPDRLIVVAGTGTEIGKTWWTCAIADSLRADGVRVAARKPAQSFDPTDPPERRDAALLAAATGEHPHHVCSPLRSYEAPMAPPMAADALGRPPISLTDLVAEIQWPENIDVGFVETAGGIRSPIAHDGDNLDLVRSLHPDLVLLVADAGLGTINLVRLTVDALAGHPVVVILNRYDPADDLHTRNRAFLLQHDHLTIATSLGELARHSVLATRTSSPSSATAGSTRRSR